MCAKDMSFDARKALARLVQQLAIPQVTEAAKAVAANRRLIRKAMRLGHSLETIARELRMPKRTLQRHMNNAGLFFRKPRTKKGHAVKKNLAAISRAKMRVLANV
jgi:AraC-like DNA-binding protein